VSEEPLVPDHEALRMEYDALREDLRYTGARVDGVRSFGVAAVGAVLTLAIQQHLAVIALAAMVITYCFTLIDLVNAHRYGRFAQRAKRVERALDAYVEHERLGAEPIARDQVAKELLRLGKRPYQAELNESGRSELAFVHPRPVFKFLYPALLFGSAALAVVIEARNGSAQDLAIVTTVALGLLALTLPRFADPTWKPVAWWRGKGRGRGRWIAWRVVPVGIAALLGLGLFAGLPALGTPPVQDPGTISVGLAPSARDLSARLDLAPTCSASTATLELTWHGSADNLIVGLPSNFTTAGGGRSVSIDPGGSSAKIALRAEPGEELAGRCTLALPGLVGSGQAEAGLTRLRLPRSFGGFELGGRGPAPTARVGPCAAAAVGAPASTCAGLLHLVEAGSSDQRVEDLALGGAAVLAALILFAAYMLAYLLP
jgi:hypothetical protein